MRKDFASELEKFLPPNRGAQPQVIPGSAADGVYVSQYASRQQIVRRAITPYQSWIESVLGTSLERALLFDLNVRLTPLASCTLVPNQPHVHRGSSALTTKLAALLTHTEFPPQFVPLVEIDRRRDPKSSFQNGRTLWSIDWSDGPVALHFRDLPGPVLAVHTPYVLGTRSDAPQFQETIIAARETVSALLQLLDRLHDRERPVKLWEGAHEEQVVSELTWDDLVLDAAVTELVRNDFETFFEREPWFRAHRLPFRRGYLLYGAPGNGKTSVIKAMMHSRRLDGFSTRLFSEYADDDDLLNLFRRAAEAAPALVILEDIDRAFPRHRESRSKVSLQQLLNCLDGLGTQDGIIVVATANDPTALDPAILRRPGRFDRVVCFPSPESCLRRRYFQKLHPEFDSEMLERAVAESEGFSFAQLREAYILAGQYAFEGNREIGRRELLLGVTTLRRAMRIKFPSNRSLGFSARAEFPAASEPVLAAKVEAQ